MAAGYQVVQTAWDAYYSPSYPSLPAGWPDPSNGGNGGGLGSGTSGLWTKGGMCVQGESAGGAAGVYALAWYGAGSGTGTGLNYVDKLSLISAPPLADVELGCKMIVGLRDPTVQVCPSGQLGCNPNNNPLSWTQDVLYSDAAANVREWTGLDSCAAGSTTSASDNDAWKDMSIVDGVIGTFSYSSTNITGWVCSSVYDSSDGKNDGVMNNSSPEAQLFFGQFTSVSQIPMGLTVNGMVGCANDENAGQSGPPPNGPPSNYTSQTLNGQKIIYGWQAIEWDMLDDPNAKCVSHHGH